MCVASLPLLYTHLLRWCFGIWIICTVFGDADMPIFSIHVWDDNMTIDCWYMEAHKHQTGSDIDNQYYWLIWIITLHDIIQLLCYLEVLQFCFHLHASVNLDYCTREYHLRSHLVDLFLCKIILIHHIEHFFMNICFYFSANKHFLPKKWIRTQKICSLLHRQKMQRLHIHVRIWRFHIRPHWLRASTFLAVRLSPYGAADAYVQQHAAKRSAWTYMHTNTQQTTIITLSSSPSSSLSAAQSSHYSIRQSVRSFVSLACVFFAARSAGVCSSLVELFHGFGRMSRVHTITLSEAPRKCPILACVQNPLPIHSRVESSCSQYFNQTNRK